MNKENKVNKSTLVLLLFLFVCLTGFKNAKASDNITIACDDVYEIWVNGNYLGGGNNWTNAQTFSLDLNSGDIVAISATDNGGAAGLIAELNVNGDKIGSNSEWKISYSAASGWKNTGFDDGEWDNATEYGSYGVNPWSLNVSGMTSDTPAKWIWSSDNESDNSIYLRYTITINDESEEYPYNVRRGDDMKLQGSDNETKITQYQNDANRWGRIEVSAEAGDYNTVGTGLTMKIEARNEYGPTYPQRILLKTADQDRVVVAFDGNVGIGTTSPEDNLHLNGTGDTFFRISNDQTISGAAIGIQSNEDLLINHMDNNNIIFATDNAERIKILNNGEVVINNLRGTGTRYVCVTGDGTIFASSIPCN
ncbi:MAG: hypothetical protein HQK83_11585 [Fibrobacteria bacterium]|nr:hypothetical protein [Fibrobacteria bacterium]